MSYTYNKNDVTVYNNRMGRYKTRRQLNFINKFLRNAPLRILDIGGGNGRLAVPLAELGHQVTVVDISEEALGFLQAEHNTNIDCILSDAMSLTCPCSFDVVISVDSVKYLVDAATSEVCAKVHRLLSEDGIWIFSDMNAASWRSFLRKLLGRSGMQYHIRAAAEYLNIFEEADFKIEGTSGYCWMPFCHNSNSSLVSLFGTLEGVLRLDRWFSQSPWVLVAARKCESILKSESARHDQRAERVVSSSQS